MIPPEYSDVAAAHERLQGDAITTPLVRSDRLDEQTGREVLVKAECLQWTGSFKYRGARNRILCASSDELARGVVAYSSGNHAQGVVLAAARAGTSATIVMPSDSPAAKVEGVRVRGGEVVFYDRVSEDRIAIGQAIAKKKKALLIPPYEDPFVIAGQGTVGMEIFAQCNELGVVPKAIVSNVGGGGLTAGIALVVEHNAPNTHLYCAEPAGFDDHARSLLAGSIQANPSRSGSICDALLTDQPGDLTFAINRRVVKRGLIVDDQQVKRAMAFALRHLKLVLEPGGAASLAAVLSGQLPGDGPVVVVATGGNVDPALLAEIAVIE